ncbi:hypothetical protein [Deinococcus hopiensis]|uniref:hypothetical protein n=1 Tax=Deinococcus hopiensis TaxID=309885 RepID=UPI00111BE04B|nr:hypothetical protein [Deinococcus hopiensis]
MAEALPALLHRRTVTLGALIAAVTMTNVFALNLFYDVPVKLFSAHLLLASLALLAGAQARPGAFLRGCAAPAQKLPPRPGLSAATAWILTVLLLAGVGWRPRGAVKSLQAERGQEGHRAAQTSTLSPGQRAALQPLRARASATAPGSRRSRRDSCARLRRTPYCAST